jgi:hypothetical protein
MCNPLDQDKLLNWSAFQYADESLCLAALNQLVKYDHISLFFYAIPVFCHTAFTVPFGRPFFNSDSLYPLPILASGGATGLRGTFPDHPRPFHLTFTDIHNNIYTPMGALPDGTRTRADLAVVVEIVLILPSTTLPSAPRRHTHISMARCRFLPWKKFSPFGGIRTH